jgi:hypothetical protein
MNDPERVATIYGVIGKIIQPFQGRSTLSTYPGVTEQLSKIDPRIQEGIRLIREVLADRNFGLIDDWGKTIVIPDHWTPEVLERFAKAVEAETGAQILCKPSIDFLAHIQSSGDISKILGQHLKGRDL